MNTQNLSRHSLHLYPRVLPPLRQLVMKHHKHLYYNRPPNPRQSLNHQEVYLYNNRTPRNSSLTISTNSHTSSPLLTKVQGEMLEVLMRTQHQSNLNLENNLLIENRLVMFWGLGHPRIAKGEALILHL